MSWHGDAASVLGKVSNGLARLVTPHCPLPNIVTCLSRTLLFSFRSLTLSFFNF
jgi:hypothetical protein